jgi:mannose-1-phosphate guanylyltransferase
MRAMILAAGFGTRMRPVTYTLSKMLVPVCNRPLVGWAVESFLRAGVRDLVVNLHHFPEAVEQSLLSRYAGEADFHFSFESEILGTGGGVKRVQPLLESHDDFLLANGDTIQFPDYAALQRTRREHDALAALVLRHPPAGDRFTAVWSDNGEIIAFGGGQAPSPVHRGEPLMFSGAHCISSRVFDYLLEEKFSGIVDDVYKPALRDRRDRLAAVVDDDEQWFDTGTPRRFLDAATRLLDATLRGAVEVERGSRIDGDCIVAESSRGRAVRSTIGARSVVEGDVRDSVVWDDCRIGRGVELDRCVVAHGVELKNRGRYRDVLLCVEDERIPRESHWLIADGLVVAAI